MSVPPPDPWSRAAVEQNRRWLMAFLLAAMGDRSAAEDLVQEVFSIAFEKRESFKAGCEFGPWLRGIARNCLKRHFQAARRTPLLVGDAIGELEAAAAESESRLLDPERGKSRLSALRECLKSLTARARRLIEGRYLRRLPSATVASQLGMTESAVNVAVFRSRSALAECVQRRMAT